MKDGAGKKVRYAKLDSINEQIVPILQRHGLAISFATDTPETMVNEFIRITLKLYHANGHSEITKYDIPLDGAGSKGGSNKSGAQAMGSSMTYAQRNALKARFNLSFTDDQTDNDGVVEDATLTDSQINDIEAMLIESKADREKFLAFIQVGAVHEILQRDFNGVCAKLRQKIAKAKETP